MKINNAPKVAVLLAAYNGMQWIEDQVNSILNQQGVDVTLFISVDLSTDGTNHWVQELADKRTNVIMLPYGERFGGAAPNFFRLIQDVDFHHFDMISFSDQDDIWLEEKLIRANLCLKETGASGYSSDVVAFWEDGKERLLKKSQPQCKYDHFFESPGPGCTFVMTRSFILELQNFIGSNVIEGVNTNHDWFIYAYARSSEMSWYIDSKALMKYRQHSSNEMGINSGFRAYISRLKLVKERWYRKQVTKFLHTFSPCIEEKVLSKKFMILNFYKLRRRLRDKIALLVLVLLGIF